MNNRRIWTAVPSVVLVLAALTSAPASAQVPEVWVVSQGVGKISIIDVASFTLDTQTIDILDPDANSIPDTPHDICFSTTPTEQGTRAFVTQGRLLSVVDVATRGIVAVHDIAQDLLVPGVTLRGCSASFPREFQNTGGSGTVRTYLHLAATHASGDALYVVVDQDQAIAGAANPVVTSDTLATGATGLDVQVLGDPHGAWFHRAWYTTLSGNQVEAHLLAKGESLNAPWDVVDSRATTLPVGGATPDRLRPGAPPGSELPVLVSGATGLLENAGSTGQCPTNGDLRAVSVSGFGIFSQTVLAVDAAGDRVVVVDPQSCEPTPFGVGTDPVDVTTLGTVDWREAYVVNRGSGSVTRLRNDGTLSTLSLQQPLAIPVAADVSLRRACTVRDVEVRRDDTDDDGVVDDFLITWRGVGCPTGETVYDVSCACPIPPPPDCPCIPCDCFGGNTEGCYCPGIVGVMPPMAAPPPNAIQVPNGVMQFPVENPWDMLGSTVEQEFGHTDQAGKDAVWDYKVEPMKQP